MALRSLDAPSGQRPRVPRPASEEDPLRAAALAYQHLNLDGAEDLARLDSWCASYKGSAAHARLFRDAHYFDPVAAGQLAEGAAALPEVGDDFVGFRLIAELGRGAFGRVFLGQQGDLADRPVALKVSTEILAESQRLAQLQHTNIVPIYSFHRRGPLQVVCMPYFGSTTLADVLADMARRQSLPHSGKGLTSTLYDRRSRTLRSVESRAGLASSVRSNDRDAAPIHHPVLPPAAEAPQTLRKLEGLTFVESILWIAARLADGLAHAHERGILHRDLKPANILLTDDGQPMLLDFNLSEDVKQESGAAALIGGTLPYMAPEHLEAFQGIYRVVDARSDLYAVGLILFELLTGRHPFERHPGAPEEAIPLMLADKMQPPPALRPLNPAVTPAVESIVRTLLQPDPDARYQSAADLRDDLERHLEHRALLHAPEPSFAERTHKFLRRNPWITSTTSVAAALTFVVLLVAGAAYTFKGRLEREQAVTGLAAFHDDLHAARLLLNGRAGIEKDGEGDGRAAARRALTRYKVLDGGRWQDDPAFRNLPPAEQKSLSAEVGELLLLLAGALPSEAEGGPDAAALAEAVRLNGLAESCYPADARPRALWAQRAELEAKLGRDVEARRLRLEARQTPVRDAWDHYLMARELARAGRLQEAIKDLREVLRQDPTNFSAWFMLGNCCLDGFADDYARSADAVAHYTTCIALRPEFYAPYFNRGLAYLRLARHRDAEADFTRALELRPDFAEAHLQRALARENIRKYPEALEDLGRAIDLETPATRVYFLRARVRQALGDLPGARRDREEGLRRRPTDEASWVARGLARVADDPKAALQDFAEAAKVNPRSRHALQNQAYVLSERLEQPREAVRLLDEVARQYPDLVTTYSSRGVLWARLGKRAAAQEDARRALTRDSGSGEVLYQAANIFALTSRVADDAAAAADRTEALRLLALALEKGFGYDALATDPDLDPLRADPRFAELVKLVAVARALQGKS